MSYLDSPVEYETETCTDCVWVGVNPTRVSPCTRHGAEELKDTPRIQESPCRRCGAPALVLDNCGFSARNLEHEGTCYFWGGSYTCNARIKPPKSFTECWTGPYEVEWHETPKQRWSKK